MIVSAREVFHIMEVINIVCVLFIPVFHWQATIMGPVSIFHLYKKLNMHDSFILVGTHVHYNLFTIKYILTLQLITQVSRQLFGIFM